MSPERWRISPSPTQMKQRLERGADRGRRRSHDRDIPGQARVCAERYVCPMIPPPPNVIGNAARAVRHARRPAVSALAHRLGWRPYRTDAPASSWNVLAGGGSAVARSSRPFDGTTRMSSCCRRPSRRRAADLCHVLGRDGYARCFSAPRGPRDRGLCVLSRVPARLVTGPAPPQAGIYPRGWLELDLPGSGVRLAAVYGPAAGPALPAFWNAAAAWLAGRTARPFVMLGDFNAGASRVDARDYRFKAGRRSRSWRRSDSSISGDGSTGALWSTPGSAAREAVARGGGSGSTTPLPRRCSPSV